MNIPQLARKAMKEGLLFRTWGNLSKRNNNDFLVTPSGRGYENMEEEDLVTVHGDGSYEGNVKPSSEAPMHLSLYRRFSNINVIMHTHQPYGSALSLLKKDIPLTAEEAEKLGAGSIKVSNYALPGTKKLHQNVDKVAASSSCKAILLEMHGVIIMGENEEEVLENALTAENACRRYFKEITGEDEIYGKVYLYSQRSEDKISFYRNEMEIPEETETGKLHRRYYQLRQDVNAIIQLSGMGIRTDKNTTMKPYLDDFAQIVGVKGDNSGKYNIVFSDDTVLCLGSDLEDATAIQHIFEKNALAQAIARVSSHKPLNFFESLLMNQVYKRKYSKLKDLKAKEK